MAEWRMICCAVDFSEPSLVAVRQAAVVARRFDADLTLAHVHEKSTKVGSSASLFGLALEQVERSGAESQRAHAQQSSGGQAMTNLPVRSVLLTGEPASEILRYLRENPFDLLVVGTHGRTGVRALLLGSVAERLVREAPCQILVVRG